MADPRPKLAHVAMAAGVSIGTASDALRGKGRISDATRERVIAAAEALDYRPHANARILALGRSDVVALVIRQPDGPERIYWPRLQAAFTEQLLRAGVVACTMSLDDMHKLDGLPFDLVVYAGVSSLADLPAQIRSTYRVLDIDLGGTATVGQDLRDLCIGVMEHLVSKGASHPGLLVGRYTVAPREHLLQAYRWWCGERGFDPLILCDSEIHDHGIDIMSARGRGMDALFAVQAELAPVAERLSTEADSSTLQVVSLSADPSAPSKLAVSHLSIDGGAIGAELAAMAIADLAGDPVPPLHLVWELDQQPWRPPPPVLASNPS